MDYIAALFVVLAVVIAGLYVLIWVNPTILNPFLPNPGISVSLKERPVSAFVYDLAQPTATFPPTWTPTATPTVTPTRLPSSTPLPTRTPTPRPQAPPNWSLWISGMRGRHYPGGDVILHGTFGGSDKFTTYLIFYPSEGLSISGMMNVPKGPGIFPVIILCHGYIHPDKYATGNDTWRQAFYLSEHGYITIAPDYRGHAASDNASSIYHIGYAQDVLNLVGSLHTIDHADPRRVGLWGHSMGGGVALKAAVTSKKIDAVALFGSVHGDERVNFTYGMGNGPGAYGVSLLDTPSRNNLEYKRISPINYLDLAPPLSIHHGTSDMIVPYQWSEDLFRAAQEQEAVSELYLYPGAGHTFYEADWDLAMERTLEFFDKYVKNGGS
ncbi:MAG: alpha/beta fold hydrolase [Anaerolineae bacterium]|nr:alpha/beta fold hydrolase [Anaerolineae bacterium]